MAKKGIMWFNSDVDARNVESAGLLRCNLGKRISQRLYALGGGQSSGKYTEINLEARKPMLNIMRGILLPAINLFASNLHVTIREMQASVKRVQRAALVHRSAKVLQSFHRKVSRTKNSKSRDSCSNHQGWKRPSIFICRILVKHSSGCEQVSKNVQLSLAFEKKIEAIESQEQKLQQALVIVIVCCELVQIDPSLSHFVQLREVKRIGILFLHAPCSQDNDVPKCTDDVSEWRLFVVRWCKIQ
mmetsp:Transcript_27604/g.69406  ORF Transcript_27604/g.69406 Transcript_27604/m.69406 type:complete len:244 (+) Transcript_27604:2203-2934(+)